MLFAVGSSCYTTLTPFHHHSFVIVLNSCNHLFFFFAFLFVCIPFNKTNHKTCNNVPCTVWLISHPWPSGKFLTSPRLSMIISDNCFASKYYKCDNKELLVIEVISHWFNRSQAQRMRKTYLSRKMDVSFSLTCEQCCYNQERYLRWLYAKTHWQTCTLTKYVLHTNYTQYTGRAKKYSSLQSLVDNSSTV